MSKKFIKLSLLLAVVGLSPISLEQVSAACNCFCNNATDAKNIANEAACRILCENRGSRMSACYPI